MTPDLVELKIPGLAAMGLRVPAPVRCLNLSEQVAQKLHACTGPYSQGRARDGSGHLAHRSVGNLDIMATGEAAKRLFV